MYDFKVCNEVKRNVHLFHAKRTLPPLEFKSRQIFLGYFLHALVYSLTHSLLSVTGDETEFRDGFCDFTKA